MGSRSRTSNRISEQVPACFRNLFVRKWEPNVCQITFLVASAFLEIREIIRLPQTKITLQCISSLVKLVLPCCPCILQYWGVCFDNYSSGTYLDLWIRWVTNVSRLAVTSRKLIVHDKSILLNLFSNITKKIQLHFFFNILCFVLTILFDFSGTVSTTGIVCAFQFHARVLMKHWLWVIDFWIILWGSLTPST